LWCPLLGASVRQLNARRRGHPQREQQRLDWQTKRAIVLARQALLVREEWAFLPDEEDVRRGGHDECAPGAISGSESKGRD